jgi:hypothetical protein
MSPIARLENIEKRKINLPCSNQTPGFQNSLIANEVDKIKN